MFCPETNTFLLSVVDQGQTGRIWQGYGTMDNYQSNNGPPPATPLHQSHAAYYHAVSNYMYPSYDENTLGNSEDGGSRSGSYGINECVPTQYAIPGHGRRASQGSTSSGRRHERRSDDDNWLWGMYDMHLFSFFFFCSWEVGVTGKRRSMKRTVASSLLIFISASWSLNLSGCRVVSVSACWLCFESPVACCSGCCCCL